MHPLAELLLGLVMVLMYCVIDIVRAVTPAFLLPKKDVRGQLVLITGAGSGLGRLMSISFAKLGCNLVLWDINKEGNEETASQAREHSVKVSTHVVDLSSREEIYKAAEQVKKEVGNVDILVNNAGIVTGRKFLQSPDHLVQKTMDVNAMAHFWTTKSFLPFMMKRNAGHVVSIASGAGHNGVPGLADYCASKFAAVGFDESLRNELLSLGKDGVKTTVVCPYFINTGMFTGVTTKYPRILPILEPEYVVGRIIEAVLTNQEVLMMPRMVYVTGVIKSMVSARCYNYIMDVTGVAAAMNGFVGRSKKD